MQEKFLAVEADINRVMFERETEVHTAILAILSRRHHFQLGSPGVAKSMLVEQIVERIEGLDQDGLFKWLLTKFTVPEELFGGPDFLLFKDEGIYKRVTKRKLPSAHFAFLDETFKGSSSILNALLKIMNEREFDNVDDDPRVPLLTMFGASNEGPQSNELEALADRFTIWHKVKPIADMGQFIRMLSLQEESGPQATITLDDIYEAQRIVDAVEIPDDVLESLWELRTKLHENDVRVTDRRFRQSLAIIKAEAFINGRDTAEVVDTKPLQHVMWRDESQIDFVRKCVLDLADPLERDTLNLLAEVEKMYSQFQEVLSDTSSKTMKTKSAIETWAKIKEVNGEIAALREREEKLGRSCAALNKLVARKKEISKSLLSDGMNIDNIDMKDE